jgi:peptidyl-lysine (3S)-dioxygenase / protease
MNPIAELLTSYADLNASHVAELDTEPSPLQFMRFVALNTPFIVKHATFGWRATNLWSSSYFRTALKSQTVNVAVTPSGYAHQQRVYTDFFHKTDTFIGTPTPPLVLQMEL